MSRLIVGIDFATTEAKIMILRVHGDPIEQIELIEPAEHSVPCEEFLREARALIDAELERRETDADFPELRLVHCAGGVS
jgi:hypothetical protein